MLCYKVKKIISDQDTIWLRCPDLPVTLVPDTKAAFVNLKLYIFVIAKMC